MGEQVSDILGEIGGYSCGWIQEEKRCREVRAAMDSGQPYDIAMVDWIMPDMDGVETTRQIRKITGPDTTIIIISAYDWSCIEEEACRAGANYFISSLCLKLRFIIPFLIWAALRKSAVKKNQTGCCGGFRWKACPVSGG